MPIECNEIQVTADYLSEQFKVCKRLKAEDMRLLVALLLAISECGSLGEVQNNRIKVIDFGAVVNTGAGYSIADTINALTQVTVASDEVAVFKGTVVPSDTDPAIYNAVYVANSHGKGTYGTGGTVTLVDNDLQVIEFSKAVDTSQIDVKVLDFGFVNNTGAGYSVSTAINNMPEAAENTIEDGEVVLFKGIVQPYDRDGYTSFSATYMVKRQQSGQYGQNGNITLVETDLERIEWYQLTERPEIDDPNAVIENLGEIPDGDFVTEINTTGPYTITDDANWYFEYTVSGKTWLYGSTLSNGVYGTGQTQVAITDFFLVWSEETSSNAGFLGKWDASTNTPTLANTDTGIMPGSYYVVTNGGTVDFGDGNILFRTQDRVEWYGDVWYKSVDNYQPTTTDELINQGADNTSTYVEHDELGNVAITDNYNDLINRPSLPTKSALITLDKSELLAGADLTEQVVNTLNNLSYNKTGDVSSLYIDIVDYPVVFNGDKYVNYGTQNYMALAFSSDGLRVMYNRHNIATRIDYLNIPFDYSGGLSQASYEGNYDSNFAGGFQGNGLWLSADGNTFATTSEYNSVGGVQNTMLVFSDNGTPWDYANFSLTSEWNGIPTLGSIHFSQDGSQLFMQKDGTTNKYVIEKYNLSSPFDLSTRVLDSSQLYSFLSNTNFASDLVSFSPDLKYIYSVGENDPTGVTIITLDTPGVLTSYSHKTYTLNYQSALTTLGAQTAYPNIPFINSTGEYLFIASFSGTPTPSPLWRLDLTAPHKIGTEVIIKNV